MWIEQDSLYSRMEGKEHRDQFPSGETSDIPSCLEGGQGEELLCPVLGGEHRQYLFARVREDTGQLQALATVPDYQVALMRRVLF